MTVNAGHRIFELRLTKDKKVCRKGGGYRLNANEKALDIYNDDMLQSLFYDFITELFIYSNFKLYNPGVKIEKNTLKNDDAEYSFMIKVSNTKALALSKIQVNKRDNPIIEE